MQTFKCKKKNDNRKTLRNWKKILVSKYKKNNLRLNLGKFLCLFSLTFWSKIVLQNIKENSIFIC